MLCDFNAVFNKEPGVTAHLTASIDPEVFKKLLGDPTEQKFTMTFKVKEPIYAYVPIRRHKKKRIQKKWLKRYGYEQRQIGEVEVEKTLENLVVTEGKKKIVGRFVFNEGDDEQ